jgi:hypothetical protein
MALLMPLMLLTAWTVMLTQVRRQQQLPANTLHASEWFAEYEGMLLLLCS